MTGRINNFEVDNHRFLSNFYSCRIEHNGLTFNSVEAAYQSSKTINPYIWPTFAAASTPGKAKQLGQTIDKRSDWNEIKRHVMMALLVQKFSAHSHLRKLLLETEDAELIEGNDWGDTYWGVYKGNGQNYLGRMLMCIRQMLRDGLL